MLFATFPAFPSCDLDGCDGIELRLDLFTHWSIDRLQSFLASQTKPVMFTIRNGSKKQIHECLKLKPQYFDLDAVFAFNIEDYPDTKFILSYHNFSDTPKDLESIYFSMKKRKAFAYKIACHAASSNDALRMLLFSREHLDLSTICMGEKGEWARALGPVVGNVIDYACINQKTAPGQLTVSEMVDIYRYRSLNQETDLYGLIGDPIFQSQGHIYHNAQFCTNAVYVKMCVKAEELSEFFPLAEELGFKGLSVTMPLKTAVIPFVETKDSSVNTIRITDGKKTGISTDGKGAMDLFGDVKDKVILILGAGGAAIAIAKEAQARRAHVWIHNRTKRDLGYPTGIPDHYDIVINCTPSGDESVLKPGIIVMDIVYVPRDTDFLKKAKQLGCQVVYGEEMFFNQAALQREFWGCDRQGNFKNIGDSGKSHCHC
ncbi:MAG TPA: type I 3-dehydroquinate dehydratase [Chlamydiales bacterium]|nr:type I 3-dehydroquinate dehydratase [Chlamydiales bacterium]